MSQELTPPEIKTRDVYDRRADRYAGAWGEAASRGASLSTRAKARFEQLLPAGRILEIGAGGTGRAANWFVGRGYDYLGTDVSRGMLDLARQNSPGAGFEQVSVYDLDFDQPFDGFWCSAVLLHLPKARLGAALAAIHRNMKPGACGFVSIKEGDGEVVEPDGRFHAYWSDDDFSGRLAGAGYRIIERDRLRMGGIDWLTYIVRVEAAPGDPAAVSAADPGP